jgi:HEAT repeat protein
LFGVIGAGRVVGMLISGFVTSALVRAVGTTNLIVVIIGLMFVFIGLVVVIAKRYALPGAGPRGKGPAATPAAASSPQHVRYAVVLSVMLLIVFVSLTIGDYQFKAIAKLTYPNQDDLAGYMGWFYAAVGAVAVVFQLLVTPRILRHLGVLAGLLAMPAAFLSSTVALLASPVIAVGTMLKLSDNGLQYTIHDATMQLLYFAFPASLRSRVRAVLDAMVKPMGYAAGGVVLVLLSPSPLPGESPAQLAVRVGHLGVLTLALGVVWLALAPVVRRTYVDALRLSLVRRQSDVNDETDLLYDAGSRQVLVEALRSGEPAQVLYAAERLSSSDPETLRRELEGLLHHRSAVVRAFAVREAATMGDPRAAQIADASLSDADQRVVCAGVQALGIAKPEDSVDPLSTFVADDTRPMLRDAAIISLVAHGGLSGILAGGARLLELTGSQRPADRAAAARIFGAVGQPSLARKLAILIKDPERQVRRAAAAAAVHCASPSLIEPLMEALADRALTKPAVGALAALGSRALPELGARLSNPETPRMARLHIPRVLQLIGSQEALQILLLHVGDTDEGVRQKTLASASRLRETLHAPPVDAARLRPLIHAEVHDHAALREEYLRARPWIARPLLDAQVRLELRGNITRILRICELAYSRQHVAAARSAILANDPVKRANALEVLDNVLERSVRESILDSLVRFAALSAFQQIPLTPSEPAPGQVVAWIEGRLALPGYYRRAVLLEAIGIRAVRSVASLALQHAQSDQPFLRENALIALAACEPEGWRAVMQQHASGDSCPNVRAYAAYVLEHNSAGLDPEDDMYTTVEKILFLQGVSLFADVPGNELMPVARASSIVRHPKGTVIFRTGDMGDSLYVVVHGRVRIRRDNLDVAVLGAGEVFGEMSILDQAPRSMDAVVDEDADLLRLSAEEFSNALEDTAEIAAGVIRVLSQRLRETQKDQAVVNTDDDGRKTVV